ncbi:Fc.00g066330.m01.CDS01 [Cosmosporella sp. VM-42]
MPIRNPFVRRPGAGISIVTTDENQRPDSAHHAPGFERVDTVGSKGSSVMSIRSSSKGGPDTGEYKMSVVNDSGVYLPPSPTEEKGQWPRKYLTSRNSTDTRSSLGDIEHFSISRESFDSYRRSFDISARSPITPNPDFPQRQSLDSARYPRLPRSAMDRSFERQPPTAEEGFEDVGLDDHKQPAPKKRSFFSKFSETQEKHPAGQQSSSRFLSRKRAQSGQGAELGTIEQPKLMVEGQEMQ